MFDEAGQQVKKIPMRKCLGCQKCDAKHKLLRVVFSAGQLLVDKKQKFQARAGYVHANEDCIAHIHNFSCWERALKLEKGSITVKKWPSELLIKRTFSMPNIRGKGIRL